MLHDSIQLLLFLIFPHGLLYMYKILMKVQERMEGVVKVVAMVEVEMVEVETEVGEMEVD